MPPTWDSRSLGARPERASCSSRCPPRRGSARPPWLRRLRRQREHEGAALAEFAVDPDVPAVQLDEALRERQPEPRPLALLLARCSLLELLEDPQLIFRGNPGPVVGDGNAHLAVDARGSDVDRAPSRR